MSRHHISRARQRDCGVRSATTSAVLLLAGCAAPEDASLTTVAERLVGEETPPEWPPEARSIYVACGKKALASVPSHALRRSLVARDVPSMWEALGQSAMNRYVCYCRKAERPMIDSYERRRLAPTPAGS